MALLEAWTAAGRTDAGPDAEGALGSLYEAGRAAHDGVPLEAEAFARHLAAVVQRPARLPALSGPGLYLAAACVAGAPGAVERLDATLLAELARTLTRLAPSQAVAEDVLQRLREQLFVPAGRPSLLLQYGGQGALGAWLQVVAVRLLQKARRPTARDAQDGDEALRALPTPDADPELRFLKLQHRAHFKAAFAEALAAVDARGRAMLQLSLVEGLSIDDIGRVYAVHRATAARWVAAARDALVAETRGRLAARLAVDAGELDEVMGAVLSNLSISLASGLARGGE